MSVDLVAGATAVGTLVTAGAVVIGVAQLRLARTEADRLRRSEQTSFEDDLSREYRALVGEMPAEAFFADGVPEDLSEYRRSFYRYFDLSNEQLFYANNGRVSDETRTQWEDGIANNLRLPAFQAAWLDLFDHLEDETFEDLRELRRARRTPGPVDHADVDVPALGGPGDSGRH